MSRPYDEVFESAKPAECVDVPRNDAGDAGPAADDGRRSGLAEPRSAEEWPVFQNSRGA